MMCAGQPHTISTKTATTTTTIECGWCRQYGCQFMVMSVELAKGVCFSFARSRARAHKDHVRQFHDCHLMLPNRCVFIYLFKEPKLILSLPFSIWVEIRDSLVLSIFVLCWQRDEQRTEREHEEEEKTQINYKEIIYAWTNFFCDLLHPLAFGVCVCARFSLRIRYHKMNRFFRRTNVCAKNCFW